MTIWLDQFLIGILIGSLLSALTGPATDATAIAVAVKRPRAACLDIA
ncbi:MAG: hypothetical protein RIB69_03620 [Roseovarius sp.]